MFLVKLELQGYIIVNSSALSLIKIDSAQDLQRWWLGHVDAISSSSDSGGGDASSRAGLLLQVGILFSG
jgi:hypothetical protein